MRPVISYDDITLPYQAETPSRSSPRPPPHKRRKWTNQKSKHPSQRPHQDHGRMSLDVEDATAEVEGRELTHEDIWDDSSLIAAWNAATEEYKAYNGPEKGWKTEPVHKSPLWYNVPTKKVSKTDLTEDSIVTAPPKSKNVQSSNDQEDSTPLNFDTFVPSHNPSFDLPLPSHPSSAPGPDYVSHFLPEPPGSIVDEDEAFTRALGAMYWGGYWTAVYHCRKSIVHKRPRNEEITDPDGNGEDEVTEQASDEEGEDVETGFVSTQR